MVDKWPVPGSKIKKDQGSESLKENTFENRKKIVDALKKELESNDKVKAAFITGSDIQNKGDEYSDIDFDIILDSEDVDEINKAVKANLEKFAPIRNEYKRQMSKNNLLVIY